VFGRPDQAQADKLFIATAGAADAVERISPALDAMGQRTFIVGNTPAQANLLTLIGNFLITCVIEGLAEETSFLVGTTGTGKTHLAIAIARSCIRSGLRGCFFNTPSKMGAFWHAYDRRTAGSSHPSLRHYRNRQRKLALQKPRLTLKAPPLATALAPAAVG
jgi:hypothetical protein